MRKIILAVCLLLFIGTMFAGEEVIKKPVTKPKPLVTFIELGSVNCIPCKMMKPVMEEIEKEYGDTISVVFYDVNKNRQMASKYKIKLIPTQVFLDKNGKEFHRHEGFYPKADIMNLVDKHLGIKRVKQESTEVKK